VRTSTLSRNRGAGLYAQGGILSFTNAAVRENELGGITLDGALSVLVDRTQVVQNTGGDGIRVTNAYGTILDVIASAVRTNAGSGITVGAGTTTVRASNIDANGVHGIRVQGQGALTLPWSPSTDPQATVIGVPQATNACLSDERPISANSAISVVHATLQDMIIPSGLVAGPVDVRPRYRILNSGNQISFLQ
jgi:parallel beta helix pectate lyase-like protein